MLKENERLESLGYNGLSIIQSSELYRFTSDAVTLANSVAARRGDRVCELGAGSGIAAILIAAKRGASVVGIEIQSRLADMSRRSVEICGLSGLIDIREARIQDAPRLLGCGGFDIVVTNPPYGKKADAKGIQNPSDIIARTEAEVTLSEIIGTAARLLRFGGAFYIIIKSLRLSETLTLMTNEKIEPKELTLYAPAKEKNPDVAIVRGVRGGKTGLSVKLAERFTEAFYE
ncbi:MAG: methyltransferase [Clostridiales bacterium]|jgi:tRNA1Val (adenine37-N6)-methyltransferase|nr:methyltransferase [Clostridiales bacterium]